MLKKFDLFVIGAGSGGVRAARMAVTRFVGIAESWSSGEHVLTEVVFQRNCILMPLTSAVNLQL